MKKIMSLMLGLSLVLGASAMFAQDKPADTTKTNTTKPAKKKVSKKKKDAAAAATTPEKK